MGELNTKMTALADEVRALSGGANALGIDAMTSSIDAANSEVGAQTDIIALIKEAANTLPNANGGEEKMILRNFTNYTNNTLSSMGYGAFAFHSTLQSVNLPNCLRVGNSGFAYCSSLTTVNMPKCSYVYTYGFRECIALSSITLPACKILRYAFYECENLAYVSVPSLTALSSGAFVRCSALQSFVLPSTCSQIYPAAFQECTQLSNLKLEYPGVVALSNVNAFNSSPMSKSSYTGAFGSIYVPASLVSSYKTATNWATYADRITAIVEE